MRTVITSERISITLLSDKEMEEIIQNQPFEELERV